LIVKDEDIGSDDIVGQSTFKVSALCINNGIDEWFEIQHQGKSAGRVHLRSHWTPDS
jgi:hypothetical protein